MNRRNASCSVLLLWIAAIGSSRDLIATERLPAGITPPTKEAIDRGLAYLARTQDQQGAWTNQGGYGEYPVAMTALAGMALLMDGNSTTQGRYAVQVDRAARYLVRNSRSNGLIGPDSQESRPMFGHGFAMLFLSQLLGMTEDVARQEQIRSALVKGIELTGRAQSKAGGWIYTPDGNSDEGSVTITQVQALRSCRNVGVTVPKSIIDQAMEYLAQSQNSDGGIRYTLRQPGGASRPAISAAAVCCWFNAGDYHNPRAQLALEYSKRNVLPTGTQGGHDYYGNLYFAQALYISSSPFWEEYFSKRRDFLLAQQFPNGSWMGDYVGDIYGTALALMTLQLPYNQLPIMER